MAAKLPAKPEWLRTPGRPANGTVDRQANAIRGGVIAQEGPFKTEGRGEFDGDAIHEIVRLANVSEKGLKARFAHPTESDDGLGKFLGRWQGAKISSVMTERDGKRQKVLAARGDLFFDRTALEPPPGGGGKPYGQYVMDVTESDPDAISTSLVLHRELRWRLNEDGTPQMDADGNDLPPLWWPTQLHASDVVDTGDAVDGILSAESLTEALSVGLTDDLRHLLRFDRVARLGSQLLDGMFANDDREVIQERLAAWVQRYLDHRFGEHEPLLPSPELERLDRIIRQNGLTVEALKA